MFYNNPSVPAMEKKSERACASSMTSAGFELYASYLLRNFPSLILGSFNRTSTSFVLESRTFKNLNVSNLETSTRFPQRAYLLGYNEPSQINEASGFQIIVFLFFFSDALPESR